MSCIQPSVAHFHPLLHWVSAQNHSPENKKFEKKEFFDFSQNRTQNVPVSHSCRLSQMLFYRIEFQMQTQTMTTTAKNTYAKKFGGYPTELTSTSCSTNGIIGTLSTCMSRQRVSNDDDDDESIIVKMHCEQIYSTP